MKCTVQFNERVLARAKSRLKAQAKRVRPAKASVGIHPAEAAQAALDYDGAEGKATLGQVAVWNEYGAGSVPERSFMRSWFDQNGTKIRASLKSAAIAEMRGNKNAVETCAAGWTRSLQDWMRGNGGGVEPLAESTKIAREKAGISSDPPEVATEQLVQAVSLKVVR